MLEHVSSGDSKHLWFGENERETYEADQSSDARESS